MKQKLGDIEILRSACNLTTIKDGRGAIFTWIPDEPILEFNMLHFNPCKVRGNHFHPEFTEYFLVVDGIVVMITKDPVSGKEINMQASSGTCFKTPPNTPHAVYAITQSICISMLTKQWDECVPPIIHEDIIPFNQDYLSYLNEQREKLKNGG